MAAGVAGCCFVVEAVEIVDLAMAAAVVELVLHPAARMKESTVERSIQGPMVSKLY